MFESFYCCLNHFNFMMEIIRYTIQWSSRFPNGFTNSQIVPFVLIVEVITEQPRGIIGWTLLILWCPVFTIALSETSNIQSLSSSSNLDRIESREIEGHETYWAVYGSSAVAKRIAWRSVVKVTWGYRERYRGSSCHSNGSCHATAALGPPCPQRHLM